MKFKQFLNEEPILDPNFQKEFKKIGKQVKYQDRYKEIFGKKDRIYLSYSEKFNNRNVRSGDDNDPLMGELEDLEFNHLKLSKNKYFLKHLPKGVTSFHVEDIHIEEFNETNKTVDVNIDMSYKVKHLNSSGNTAVYIKIPYKELIFLSTETEVRKKQLIEMIDNNNSLLASKNNGKEMKIVISRNPCDIGSMSTGTHWSSCMNLYTGGYKHYTREDVRYGTLIAYLILSVDKDITNPVGRVLIKPYVKGKEQHLVLIDKAYGYFPEKAKKVVKDWLDEQQQQEKVPDNYLHHSKLYFDDSRDAIHISNFKVGQRIELKELSPRLNGKKGKITNIDDYGSYTVKIDGIKKLYYLDLRNIKGAK